MGMRARSIAVVLLIASTLLAGCAGPGGATGNAATVNGKNITMADFNKQVDAVRSSMVEQGLDPKTPEGQSTLDQMRADLLNQMIDTELMRQAAQKDGITISDADVAARLQQIKTDAGGESAFKESLKQAKLTEEDFKLLVVRDQMMYERLYDKVTQNLPQTAEQVHVRHILLNTEKEANDALARVKKGEDFAAVAKAVSVDTQSKDSGGDLGFYPRGVLDSAFEAKIFSMTVNQIDAVKTDYGYHVVQVLEREPNRAIAPEIVQALGEQAISKYLDDLRTSANVVRIVQLPPTPTADTSQ